MAPEHHTDHSRDREVIVTNTGDGGRDGMPGMVVALLAIIVIAILGIVILNSIGSVNEGDSPSVEVPTEFDGGADDGGDGGAGGDGEPTEGGT